MQETQRENEQVGGELEKKEDTLVHINSAY